ncbi:MAG: PIN domain-containing protein [Ilumatobacter sp.]
MTEVVVDTSVAVPLVVTSHREHGAVSGYVGDRVVRLAAHAQLETYSVLTRLPGDARLAANDAEILLAERFGAPIQMSASATASLIGTLSAAGIVGGAVYDALIGLTASAAGSLLLTRARRAVPTLLALGVDHQLVI